MKIKGTVTYQNLSGGFWGIVDEKGKQWKPITMPEALQKDGLVVSIKAKKVDADFSIFMWGTTIEILEHYH